MDLQLKETDADVLKSHFNQLSTINQLSDLLEIKYKTLMYYLYHAADNKKYKQFALPKRTGGERQIFSPAPGLKIMQTKLASILSKVYRPKPCVHGYLPGASIVTNARRHVRKRHLLTVDLKDFFPSMNFGRVRGLFMGWPYELPNPVATALAQLCCFDNHLPQGAPSSPIVSNMICSKLDSDLMQLMKRTYCYYTRYADDMAFSTNLKDFPRVLASFGTDGVVKVGADLQEVISRNGFGVNQSKIFLAGRRDRQRVAGIIVNKKLNVSRKYVRQIRAMIHAWQKYGIEDAQSEYMEKYDKRTRFSNHEPVDLKNVLKGKIDYMGMVRGTHDQLVRKYLRQLRKLDRSLVRLDQLIPDSPIRIFTEGPTDWRHLKAALKWHQNKGDYVKLDLIFTESETDVGWPNLEIKLKNIADTNPDTPVVGIFDRDVDKICREHKKRGSSEYEFKVWGTNVKSIILPVPGHRHTTPDICIEYYYKDSELKTVDQYGKRLYTGDEFVKDSGAHEVDRDLSCRQTKKLGNFLNLIDDEVYNVRVDPKTNIALTKKGFAVNVLEGHPGFESFDLGEFSLIFDAICSVV